MKKRVRQKAILSLILSVVIIVVSGCLPQMASTHFDIASITCFRDIPGVSEEEIKAIEALQETMPYFVYGMLQSTDAFLKENGEMGGYSALLCDRLSGLFGIPFRLKHYEWGDLVEKLNSGEVHFTGEMTATEERRKIYYMSDPIANRMVKMMRIENSPALSEIALSRPLRYAFLDGTTTLEDVTALLDSGSYEAILIDDFETAYEMLASGEIDAFISENVDEAAFDVYGNVVAMSFVPLIFGPVSLTTSISELAPIISLVTKMLDNGALKHFTELHNQGYEDYLVNKLWQRLTEEERSYVINNPVVRMGAQ
jgi:ABC-type amino acid transport substrate-binding protein